MIDWTFALLFRPDIVKISLDSEAALILREAAAGDVPENKRGEDTSGSAKSSLAGVNDARPSGQYDEEGRGGRSDPLHESFGRSSQKSRFDLSFVPRENV